VSRETSLLKAAEIAAKAQRDCVASRTALTPWDQLTEHQRAVHTASMSVAIEAAGEDILDALLGVGRARRQGERLPAPAQIGLWADDIMAEAKLVVHDFTYLRSSAYHRTQRGQTEKVRRDISGSGGDLSDGLSQMAPVSAEAAPRVSRCIEAAVDRLWRGRELVLGAGHALKEAAQLIDKSSQPTIDDSPVKVDPERQAEIRNAREAQERRTARSGDLAFQGEVAG
jgi:hypothetical protein